jgi:hypothetical protein
MYVKVHAFIYAQKIEICIKNFGRKINLTQPHILIFLPKLVVIVFLTKK